MKKVLTLCIPITDSGIILGMKKRGFGSGRWNGFGGKVEDGETIEQAALRELDEEASIRDGKLTKAGVVDFSFENDGKTLQVHIFKLLNFSDKPIETEEMKPRWFSFDEIPYSQMWSGDEYWLPLLLQGDLFEGAFVFDRPSDAEYSAKILSKKLELVSVLK